MIDLEELSKTVDSVLTCSSKEDLMDFYDKAYPVKQLSREQWDKEFDFKGVIWLTELHKEYFKRKRLNCKYWSRVSIDGEYYLVPGIDDSADLIYRTKKLIDYNVIVKL